jgi:hypothetical protein
MHGRFGTEEELSLHAPALMQAAARATQSLLVLSRSAVSEEEQLLVAALAGFRQQCERLQAIALPLATMEQLAPLLEGPAPWIDGQPRLTALQQALAERCWPGQPILYAADSDARPMAEIRQVRAADLESEIRACAAWCRAQLESDAGRRLLVISAASDPSLSMQGVMLWRALAQGIGGAAAHEPAGTLLTIEGGEPLIHQVLIADVLAALRLSRDVIDWSDLSQVLRGAYFNFGEHRHMLQLEAALAAIGRARCQRESSQASQVRTSRVSQTSSPRARCARAQSQRNAAARCAVGTMMLRPASMAAAMDASMSSPLMVPRPAGLLEASGRLDHARRRRRRHAVARRPGVELRLDALEHHRQRGGIG